MVEGADTNLECKVLSGQTLPALISSDSCTASFCSGDDLQAQELPPGHRLQDSVRNSMQSPPSNAALSRDMSLQPCGAELN
mmetsp:Transcript_46702/g.111076  ORF Transcript_46702/g.111076 Transcript_46702/m.111076 type:complete len:81 (-) Transcript_46702:115-357(-)